MSTYTDEVIICSGRQWQAQWDDFVIQSPGTYISHLSCWQNIVAKTYDHVTYYLMHRRGRAVLGVLPLVWMKAKFLGNALCSMPFLDYGGIYASNATSRALLLAKAIALRDSCKAQYLELRHQEACEVDGLLRHDKVDMALELESGQELIWKQFAPKVRNQVRKASKSGLTINIGGAEYLEQFYRVFAINMRDLGSPVHSPVFFANIFTEFGNNAKIITVSDGGTTVGALICLFFKDSVFVPWASSLRQYFPKCPNNLLYWNAIAFACDNGFKYFRFGRSSIGSGTYKFKQQWGAKEIQLTWQLFFRLPVHSFTPKDTNPKYKMAAQIWRRLPLSLTLLLGPQLRKYLAN